MDVVFEAYGANAGRATLRLPLRLRAMEQANIALLHAPLRISATAKQGQTGEATLHAMPGHVLGSAKANIAVLRTLTQVVAAASTVLPTATIGLLRTQSAAIVSTGREVQGGDVTLRPPVRALAVGSVGERTAGSQGGAGLLRTTTDVFALPENSLTNTAALVPYLTMLVLVGGPIVAITDTFSASDAPDADAIQALLDLMRFSDAYTQQALVLQALADDMSLADVAAMILHADLLDTFIAGAVQIGTAQLTVMLSDSLDVGDTATALSEILAAIRDGFHVNLTVRTGEDAYTAWVMTPETKAMRSYTNWAFNSYATLGGQFLGAGPAGIYRMGGNTDDGAAIRASIRTGLLNFGSQNMKAVSRAYIGATTAGNLLLRVQATTFDGRDVEQTYRLVPANTAAPRNHRVDVGRGFRSVYWTFELANDTSGADFEVTDWHVLPVTLSGRLI